jgi:exosome complex RNA-binding protein Rrp4
MSTKERLIEDEHIEISAGMLVAFVAGQTVEDRELIKRKAHSMVEVILGRDGLIYLDNLSRQYPECFELIEELRSDISSPQPKLNRQQLEKRVQTLSETIALIYP